MVEAEQPGDEGRAHSDSNRRFRIVAARTPRRLLLPPFPHQLPAPLQHTTCPHPLHACCACAKIKERLTEYWAVVCGGREG